MDTKLIVSASPHVRSEETTQSLMANVIVALCPCVVASAIIFGMRALLVTAVSVVACVAFEWLYCKLLKKPKPIVMHKHKLITLQPWPRLQKKRALPGAERPHRPAPSSRC